MVAIVVVVVGGREEAEGRCVGVVLAVALPMKAAMVVERVLDPAAG